MLKKIILIIFFFILSSLVFSQNLTLKEAIDLVKENHPISKNIALIKKANDLSIKNTKSAYYPNLNIKGQFTYQTDVMELPFQIPGIEFEKLDQYQYRAYAELTQVIYDGGLIANQNKALELESKSKELEIEVHSYKIEEKVIDLYFSILWLEEQLIQTKLFQKDILLVLESVNAAINEGVQLKSNATILEAELLSLKQEVIKINAEKKTSIDLLSHLIGKELSEETQFINPSVNIVNNNGERPEYLHFSSRIDAIEAKKDLIKSKNIPTLGLFGQAGYGKPALNQLKNEGELYAIGGIRLNIPLTGFYTKKRELNLIDIQQDQINIEKEIFDLNQNIESVKKIEEINKFEKLIVSDEEIIKLRSSVEKTYSIQLKNGVINSNDYLKELNEKNKAIQNKILHEIQLDWSKFKLNWIKGKFQ